MYKIINPLSFPPSRRPALHLHIFSAYLNYKFCPSLRGHPVPCCQNTLRSDHFQIPVQFPGGNPDTPSLPGGLEMLSVAPPDSNIVRGHCRHRQ